MKGPQGGGEVDDVSERLETSLSLDKESSAERHSRLVQEAKDATRAGDLRGGLKLFKQAYKICRSEKIRSRIERIEELLAEDESDNEDDFVDVEGSGLLLFKELHNKLYDYQKQGVAFLFSLFRDHRKGGILADDMGLGKTIQVISFLSGMYDADHVKFTMLVVPTSLITNWTKEFAKWTPGMRVKEFHGTSKSERARNLEKVQRRGGVLITTYNMVLNNWQTLASYHGKEFTWDYMILDEAHKIKSASAKTTKGASAIPSKNRVLLTGTPVQNNLREMWALFDFACQSTLLGTSKTFKTEYENPITRAREKDATPGEKALGARMSENLMATIDPYFLRRTKAEVQKSQPSSSPQENKAEEKDSENAEGSSGAIMPKLTRKNDLIVWTFLSEVQEDIYRQFLSLDQIKELLMTTKSPLAQLNVLKKLCDHPRLLSAGAMAKMGLDDTEAGDSEGEPGQDIANVPDDTLVSESGKMVFVFALLERLREEGHRTLVFAHFRKVLDILERILKNRGFGVMRLDGTITKTAERERRITRFQTDDSYNVFLLTTQVGGVGITLTAASRVVIYDPSWNPATDAQAVDRAYRIGQKENVVIYRLITCGTVEEKIYRRQVFKDSLIKQNTGDNKNPFRYFSKQELKELFTLEDTKSSSTQLQLQALHSRQRRTDAELDQHIAHLHAMDMFGISDHDLMFSLPVHQEEAEDHEAHRYIEGRVQKAQELMKAESELQMQLAENMASSTEAAWLRTESLQPRERRQKSPKAENESPPAPLHNHLSNGVVDLENSLENGISDERDLVDLTMDQNGRETSPVPQEETRKIKTEPGKFQQNFIDHEEIVISDDETQENGFQRQEQLDFYQNKDVSMNESNNKSMNGQREIQNGDCSMNGLMIEDSIEEGMDTSAQKVHFHQSFELNVSKNGKEPNVSRNGVCDSVGEDKTTKTTPKIDQSTSGNSLLFFTAEDIQKSQLNSPQLQSSLMDMDAGTLLKHKRLSALQSSLRTQNLTKSSHGTDSMEGNFKLELDDDSDMFSDHDIFNEKETEEEQREFLSKLQLEGSFDVDKSLAEHGKRKSILKDVSEANASANESILVVSRKKRAARICSDDEDEESFNLLGASTPIAASKLNRSRNHAKAAGANTSVASRRSLVLSLLENMDSEEEEEEEVEERGAEAEDAEMNSEAEEEDSKETQEEEESEPEPSGETLHTEEEEEEEEESVQEGEESTADPDLSSTEQVEEFAAEPANHAADQERPGDYDWLVQRGREHFHLGQRDEALSFFLRAIDIKPGDPEIQLLTIQLYRQLSQRS